MAIESHAPPGSSKPANEPAAIENEIPTYRAVSSMAVASVFFGLIASLSFANFTFLLSSGLAVVLGALALRKIRRQPETLTGIGLAQAGIVLGLAFGLSSLTYAFVQNRLISSGAIAFVRSEVMPVLNEHDLDGAMWLRSMPEDRRGLTPEQVRQRFLSQASPDPTFQETSFGPIAPLIRRLKEGGEGASVELIEVEQAGLDGIVPTALVLLEVKVPAGHDHDHDHGPGEAHDHDEEEGPTYAAVRVKAVGEGRSRNWWVDDYVFPYRPKSYVAKQKPIDDGHGH